MIVTALEGTDLFIGTEVAPRQVVRVHVSDIAREEGAAPPRIEVVGDGVTTSEPGSPVAQGSSEQTLEIGITVDPSAAPVGSSVAVRVMVDGTPALYADGSPAESAIDIAEPGWTMHMVSHFHYDPVWWNTQAAYTSEWDVLDFDGSPRGDFQQSGFTLVQAHLELARQDPDYSFVLAEVDYLKPYWDLYPEDRATLRRLMDEERLELMGGTWNEPNSNLTGAELTIRNAIYGIGFQRDILGGDPQTAWQLDVFGHDPQFPGIMADAGLTSSSWARGPFHQWGPMLSAPGGEAGDATVMQFPAEFEWLSPSGRGVLTAYMANHYSSGWDMDSAPTLEAAMAAAYKVFSGLKPVAATRNVLLPVGTDYTPPNRWVTRIHREWNERYVWPRFRCALPRHFFAAVRAELAERGIEASPQSRDMNPIYTGKDVSYIDTKQAQREAEVVLADAEKWATIASLHGAAYPDDLLDKAWRQLIYGAHHDGITGSESDQVYLDLLAGWREARDLAHEAHAGATDFLAGLVGVETRGWALTVFNALSWSRTDVLTVTADLSAIPTTGLRLRDLTGDEVPFVLEHASRAGDGSLGEVTLRLLASDVPSVGHRTWVLEPADTLPDGSTWQAAGGEEISTEAYRVRVDPARGGALSEVTELATGRSLLADGSVGNELVVYDEYSAHPEFQEGPWHLVPSGTSVAAGASAATSVVIEQSSLGWRLVVTGTVGPARYTQRTSLWHGVDRVDFTTWVDEWTGSDQLLRVRFPMPIEGALPVCEVADAVIGRGFGFPDVDVADAPWTLDNPAYTWFGLSAAATVRVSDPAAPGTVRTHAIGVADIVVPVEERGAELAKELVVALVRLGVTATTSSAAGPRYGLLDVDSNLPDFRVAIGSAADNPFTAAVLERAGEAYAAEVSAQLSATGRARVWVPGATPLRDVWVPNTDLTAAGALPVLVIAGADDASLHAELSAVVAELASGSLTVSQPAAFHPSGGFDDRTVAILNRGMPGFVVDIGGVLHLSLMRSCTGWPSGVWIDPPARTTPDGSGFQLQHWTHRFDYALVSGEGDWRAADVVRRGQGFNHLLRAVTHNGTGTASGDQSFVTVEPSTVALSAMKATGNPLAQGQLGESRPRERITMRLYETSGLATEATVSGFVPFADAARTDLVESRIAPLTSDDGTVRVPVTGSEIITVTAHPDTSAVEVATVDAAEPQPQVQGPVEYSRYWLHNRGVAPTGAHPVSVHLHGPSRADGPTTLRATVSSDLTKETATGELRLDVPAGWTAEPASAAYDIQPGGMATTEIVVTPPAGGSGTHLLRAGIVDPAGARSEDVLAVRLGGEAAAPVLTATLHTGELRLAAGDTGTIPVELASTAHGLVNAEVQVLTPYGIWEATPVWTTRVEVAGPGSVVHELSVPVPRYADPGTYWVLVKVMGAGEIVYSPAIPFVVTAGS
ncbi:glycoside hydrolase family 38 C-terminal domain-containing protein [Lapillicoccus sp.]|uniref:glycoside hydrolase family 38 N-terminal domain-containing protein n=1 Tax=Lapillicoccus sp. TaxID=1909287 RepID=UPI0025F68D6A|nr:glycoside hydrolase family 38 C-terminal domain-containing protein [Lapillicoccus sp.]